MAVGGLEGKKRRALLVVGMHRSGTSALTRVLALCGAALPQNLIREAVGNETGHWEPARVVAEHDAFLAENGLSWDGLRPHPPELFQSERARALCERLRATVVDEYGSATLFVMKDPRTARLLPVWTEVLSSLAADGYALIATRHPMEVAQSLGARNQAEPNRSLLLWLRYMLDSERNTRGMPRCFVPYEELLGDWRSTIDKASEVLGIALAPQNDEAAAAIDGFLRPDQRHHDMAKEPAGQAWSAPRSVLRTWECFREAAAGRPLDFAELDRMRAELDAAHDLYGEPLAQAERRGALVAAHQHEIESLQAVLAQSLTPEATAGLRAELDALRVHLEWIPSPVRRASEAVRAAGGWRGAPPPESSVKIVRGVVRGTAGIVKRRVKRVIE